MSADRINATYQTFEDYKPHFVESIAAAERITVDPGDENFVFMEGGSQLSPKQRTHMLRMAETLKYSPSVIDTSSTGAGKSYVALGLFEELGFNFLRIISPNQLVPVWNNHFKRSGLAFTWKNQAGQEVLQYNSWGEVMTAQRVCLNRKGQEESIPIAKITTYEIFSSMMKGIVRISTKNEQESMQYMHIPKDHPIPVAVQAEKTANGITFDGFEYLIEQKDNGPADTSTTKKSKRNFVYGRNYEDFAWHTSTQKYLFVVDEAQKIKNASSNASWILASRLNSTLFPDTYADGQNMLYSGGRSRVLYLSATPFDKLEHVYVYYVVTGMSNMAVGMTSYKNGANHEYELPGVYQVWRSLLTLIDRAYEYHRNTMVKASQSLINYGYEYQGDALVPLYPQGGPAQLKEQIGLIFRKAGMNLEYADRGYYGGGGDTNVASVGAALFEIYVKFCKHVLSSFVTKPFTPNVKRYCANLFLDLDYETSVAAMYEAQQYNNISNNDNNEPGAHMKGSGTFRRYTSILKACRLARLVVNILDNTVTDKIVIFVSENDPENILRTIISSSSDKHRGGNYNVRVAAGESKKLRSNEENMSNEASLAEFQKSDTATRVLIAKLSVFSIGQSMHDLDGRFPRHTFILPDPNLTEVSQSIGRTIRVGMKSSAAVYIVYLGQLVPSAYDKNMPPDTDVRQYTYENFGEITKVYKNLMSKTLIMKQILLGSDMDFPGDFVSVKEFEVMRNGGFYQWSRNELLQKYPDQVDRLMPKTYFNQTVYPPNSVTSGAGFVVRKRFEKRSEEMASGKRNPPGIPPFGYGFLSQQELASVGIDPSGQYSIRNVSAVPSNLAQPNYGKTTGRGTRKKATASGPSFLNPPGPSFLNPPGPSFLNPPGPSFLNPPMSTGFVQPGVGYGSVYNTSGPASAPLAPFAHPSAGFPGQGFPGQGAPPPSSPFGFPGQGAPPSAGFPGQGAPPSAGFPGQGAPPSSPFGFPGQGFPGQGAPPPSSPFGFGGSSSSSSPFGYGGR
jgi:hypothetical protein